MDTLSLVSNARVKDLDGDDIGEVVGIHYVNGKLYITIDTEIDFDGEGDPDGGEEVDADAKPELDTTEEVSKPTLLRSVAGGKQ